MTVDDARYAGEPAPHKAKPLKPVEPRAVLSDDPPGRILSRPVLGGLHHHYVRV